MIPPEKDGDQDGENRYQKKTSEGFCQGDADVSQQIAVCVELCGAFDHAGRTAENKRIQPADVGADLPGSNNKYKKKDLDKQYQPVVLFYFFHIKSLCRAQRRGIRQQSTVRTGLFSGCGLQTGWIPKLCRSRLFPLLPETL